MEPAVPYSVSYSTEHGTGTAVLSVQMTAFSAVDTAQDGTIWSTLRHIITS